jgi:prepilin-type N-terminal cleavage/methylation domain-containing protein/prepilin-type processing-associated H-X9-DG protein
MSTVRSERKQGFTLVELLVVLFVIGIVLGLLLPAVQQSREAARRSICTNNLKQIGVSLASHHASFSHFPWGIKPDGRTPRGSFFAVPSPISVHVQILPFLDEAVLFNNLNLFNGLVFERALPPEALNPTNYTVAHAIVGSFLCPSDSPLQPGNNYRGNDGPSPFLHDGTTWPGGGGVFPGIKATADRDIVDGLSSTVAFSERLQGSGSDNRFSARRDAWCSGIASLGLPVDADTMATVCDAAPAAPSSFVSGMGAFWAVGGYEHTLYNHVGAPNRSSTDCSVASDDLDPQGGGSVPAGCVTARSAHPGGVNVLLTDGSVRFVKQSVQLAVWRALATRSGHEPISGIDF